MISEILEDALFAAIAAIGFSAISNPPKNAYIYCSIIAAIGHSTRFILLNNGLCSVSIVIASAIAALVIGVVSVVMSPFAKTPAETFLYPSLLPMIPGIYAYKCFGGLVMCILHKEETVFNHYLYLFVYNGLTCLFVIIGMVAGASLPIFLMKRMTYSATR